MTVIHSPCSRILLVRMMVQLPLAEAGDRPPGLVLGGADVAALITDGTVGQRKNLKTLRNPERYLGQWMLLVVDVPGLEADVRVLSPGERDKSRPHQWALLGQAVQEQQQIVELDGAFQFLAVLGSSPDSPLLRTAVEDRPPLWWDSVPWFAAGGFNAGLARTLMETGVRRVWLTEGETMEELGQINEISRRVWGGGPAYRGYPNFAVRAWNLLGRPTTNWYCETCLSL